ncbi:hypothetical protein ACIPUO_16490 [Pectobacterium carotovorum]|uniref:hypothetical protein n=1 Tax=Pectobacterium carotovorum TaxID=554 RepID=UPI0038000FD8
MASFIVRDEQGIIILDLSKSITKTLGYFTVEKGGEKTVIVPDLFGGRLWVSASIEQINFDLMGDLGRPPNIEIKNNSIQISAVHTGRCFCVYGIY